MQKIILADLYSQTQEYQKSYNLYEELLTSPYLQNSSDYKIKIRYAILSVKIGKIKEAEKIYQNIVKSQNKLYKYSPQKICTIYYGSDIFPNKKLNYINKSKKLLKKLNLSDESYFKNNIEYFCKINMQI